MAHRYLKSYVAGECIFREGELADCAYLIEKGQVLITVDKDGENIPVSVLNAGDLFGEMAIIDGYPRSASAHALENCEVSVISETLLGERVSGADPIVQLLISLLTKRIRTMNMKFKGGQVAEGEQFATRPFLRQEALKKLKLENDLLQGLARKEFFLVYQGIFDLATRELVGFEALARWKSPERGLVPPSEFIDVAEQTAVIIPMGEWIIEQGIQDLLILQNQLQKPDLKMSINVSARQLDEPTFSRQLKNIQNKYKVNPGHIKLEVTERVLHQGDHILKTIERVCEQGFSFAMDDFGTGYSSLTSLFKMNVETIKVDRSFVSTMIKDKRSRAIVQAVLAMALQLNLEIVAEGIEHEEEALLLSSLGCQLGQGYHFAKPMPLEDVLKLLAVKKRAA